MTDGTSRRRAWIAAGLSILFPGLGHAYLRRWTRMGVWIAFVFVFATVLVVSPVLPTEQLPQTLSVDALMEFQRTLPASVDVAMWMVRGLIAIDAFVIARQTAHRQAVESGRQCPECGKELEDEGPSFCPWCGAELEEIEDEEGDVGAGP